MTSGRRATPLPIHRSPDPATAIKGRAKDLGFDLVGIAPAEPPPHADFYLEWLARGHHGTMAYLARPDAVERRLDPGQALPGARSIIVVALNYQNGDDGPVDRPDRPVIARYARGIDYHSVFEAKLAELASFLRGLDPSARTRCYVDYGPVLERDHAQRAGLGWIGKNTVLIHPALGSYFFLGEVVTDLHLTVDPSFRPDHCGTCSRCIDACPTGAITAPRVLDSRLCISYLTIELRGPIPRELRPLIGNRVFGCDICQEVCPWNKEAPATREPRFEAPLLRDPELLDLMALSEADFEQRFSGSPISRARRGGFLRNVAVALGNWADPAAVPALARGLNDPDSLVRGHAAWALGRIATVEATTALEARVPLEEDAWVASELREALAERAGGSEKSGRRVKSEERETSAGRHRPT